MNLAVCHNSRASKYCLYTVQWLDHSEIHNSFEDSYVVFVDLGVKLTLRWLIGPVEIARTSATISPINGNCLIRGRHLGLGEGSKL